MGCSWGAEERGQGASVVEGVCGAVAAAIVVSVAV